MGTPIGNGMSELGTMMHVIVRFYLSLNTFLFLN